MAGQIVECKVCHQVGPSKLRGSTWISFLLFWFVMMVPGIIYMIWRRGGIGVCQYCSSSAVVPYSGKRTKLVQENIFQPRPQISTSDVQQVQCPDCRELIRFDARKCKHCGSMIEEKAP